jgi:hypothetical protein
MGREGQREREAECLYHGMHYERTLHVTSSSCTSCATVFIYICVHMNAHIHYLLLLCTDFHDPYVSSRDRA